MTIASEPLDLVVVIPAEQAVPTPHLRGTNTRIVIPAEAGIQAGRAWGNGTSTPPPLDSRFRGNDVLRAGNDEDGRL